MFVNYSNPTHTRTKYLMSTKWSRTVRFFIPVRRWHRPSVNARTRSTMIVLVLILSISGLSLAVQTTPVKQDSYLSAYAELHPTTAKTDRDYSLSQGSDFTSHGYAEGPVYRPEGSYPASASQYLPPKPEYGPPVAPIPQYGPPKLEYGPPKPEYGPPHLEYGPPKPVYGPPKPIYGPPTTG